MAEPGGPLFALSTASVYPESVDEAFGYAARLGYDAVEVMVSIDERSQSTEHVAHLAEYHQMPVCAVHAPCLLITQRVWGTEPWGKLERSAEMAHALGADVVVVHPPFRWQRDYATGFVEGIADLEQRTGLAFAVENMYPWRATAKREMEVYAPGWDPSQESYAHATVDLSHSATAQTDPVEMAKRLGPRLRHLHLADGSGSAKDEHLIPGRGSQPCGEMLEHLAAVGFSGHVVAEVNTRKARDRDDRERDLAEALAFARLYFSSPRSAGRSGPTAQ
ncbi:sugar phosphate isomerase/epimerase [Nocardioides mangrovicus]|uniref:Sugar phosphate isomerase/epimerase n=1 Tax=Nocardioides mangrovicus TaxID=2478913 RepID=A0A3L8P7X8_9ACTN|nr:sugar phosphate isomerase/epimerase [Nocardioides mangrovicus]RLV50478.1 sugar phosphate isomerase/epimerase [Nocardioides mangrovicus]